MSIVKIPAERKEIFSLLLHPETDYLSSSIEIAELGVTRGVSGSAPLRRRGSHFVKDFEYKLYDTSSLGVVEESPIYSEVDRSKSIYLDEAVVMAEAAARSIPKVGTDISFFLTAYMAQVNASPEIAANTKEIFITRFDPPFTHNKVSVEKTIIQRNLMPFYRPRYSLCEMSYTNYHTLNFFSAPNTPSAPPEGDVARIPDDSAIIYQNFSSTDKNVRPYSPQGPFSLDFYINPRYSNEEGSEYTPGTILHLSSTFAISIISGSSRDSNNLVDGYAIMLQLSHSADIPPAEVDFSSLGTYPYDLIFTSSDNSLSKNNWHHCTARWGTNSYNNGTGSIVIDGKASTFNVNSSSILPPSHVACSALFLGNYFEGSENEGLFFNDSTVSEGVNPTIGFGNEDPDYTMRHPLNAEVHEIKIYSRHLSNKEIAQVEKRSPTNFGDLLFYVPPFFVPKVRDRNMLLTPFQSKLTSSLHPFNEEYSFGVGGLVMNLENHVTDFVTKNNPRCFHLTASTIEFTVTDTTANQHVFNSGSLKKRNLTVLPNDNGRFTPDFSLMKSHVSGTKTAITSAGGENLSIISLRDLIAKDRIIPGMPTTTPEAPAEDDISGGSIAAGAAGVTPEDFTGDVFGSVLTIAQRTRDRTSNEICFFDISNLYYGNRIQDKTFYLSDPLLTGSDGKMKITLRDNGHGGLYRCDAETPHPKWSNVGNVLYEEGIAVVKSPALSFFGKDVFELKMKGEQANHISIVNVHLAAGAFNSSSNPNYIPLSASGAPSDENRRFVYIDSLNLHDENLNVVARANLAQPIKKRIDDSMLLRFKMDF